MEVDLITTTTSTASTTTAMTTTASSDIAAAVEQSVADLIGEESNVDANAAAAVAADDDAQMDDGGSKPPARTTAAAADEVSTSFKLQVSGTDDEEEEEEGEEDKDSEDLNSSAERRGNNSNSTPVVKQLSQSPLDDKESINQRAKRKRYDVRRSGSEECLLGFDEQSGEAELVRDDNEKLLGHSDNNSSGGGGSGSGDKKTNFEGKVGRNSPMPPAAKKLKHGASGTSPARSSPKHQAAMKTLMVKLEDISPKASGHVVADDANGGTVTSQNKSTAASTAATTPVSSTKSRHSTPTAGKKTPTLPAQSEFYRKPFEYGWKRELVWRANLEASKDKADVYFISPGGKKLRTRNDILPLLEGELTLDHFNFIREPLGVGPEFEIVRSAKPSSRTSVAAATIAAAPPAVTMGKRISKPKGPKGASPPPEGWTPTRALKVNNAALLSSAKGHGMSVSSGGGGSGSASTPASTPSGGRGGSSANSHNASGSSGGRHSKSKRTSNAVSKTANANSSSNTTTNNNNSNAAGSTPTATSATTPSGSAEKTLSLLGRTQQDPCTMACVRAKGEVPQLQCIKCVRLYHHACVGEHRKSGGDFVCEACQSPLDVQQVQSLAVTTPVTTLSAAAVAATPAAATHKAKSSPTPSAKSSVTKSSATKSSAARAEKKMPQTIAVVKGKKYVMVSKPNIISKRNAYANDIENDLKQINESIRNSRKPSSVPLEAAQTQHAGGGGAVGGNAGAPIVDQSNKLFATNFFANVSFAYDSLLCILKYLKIHERPRAASVCKLWNVAAKDTSLWHTVRMKNSKVYNWSGFAAALRRGETKHLDLRKMLVASTRGDETWHDFSEHIGTVGSLEVVDLCRCSARVVESLFQSNKHLRVLNAIAINDDTINLEYIGNLQNLEELRLRTCEPGVLGGELQPLKMLSNLVHLSLTAIRCLGAKGVEVFAELTQLKSLELGECGDFDETFANVVLPKLNLLQRLRLENGQETSCCTLAILDAVAQLDRLHQLELVNFDIKPGFDERMSQCTNLRKLLIIPTYISQSATTNHIVLSAVQQVADTLHVFTWGVTVELLRVTALYVDQCEESSKKEKHHFDECIPVLKPVPGAPPADDDGDDTDEQTKAATQSQKQRSDDDPNSSGHANDVPQIEILPLDKVESILADNLPNTKYTIVKVPYHATCKQQLVE